MKRSGCHDVHDEIKVHNCTYEVNTKSMQNRALAYQETYT